MKLIFNEKGERKFPPLALVWRYDFFYISFYNYFVNDWWFAIYKIKNGKLKIEKYR